MSLTEIKIINKDGSQSSENLDLTKTLDSIRKKLEKENKIDDKISFSQKFNGEFVEITRGNEEDFILNDIIENDSKKLYLKKATTSYWKFLNKLHKLNWGWTISPKELKRANEPAFILQSAEIREMETTKDGKDVGIKVSYKDPNLFFISDNNVQDFAELLEINSKNTQPFKVYEKARFEICKLKVTKEFNKTVEDATGKDAINIQKFENIIKKYGQFIPTIIIFGQTIDEKGENYCRDWNCIEFLKPKSIFHFVDDNLRKKIYSFFGKRILHSEITSVDNNNNNDDDDDDDDIGIKDNNITKTIKLPKSVSGIFSNKYADCSIFATVVGGVSAKSYYHCQILNSSGKEPKLMIQCLKVPNDNKLLVGWIVVGYDTYLKSIFSNNKDMQLNVLKEECKPDNNPIKLDLSKLGLSNATQHYCIGIPIINTNNIINKSDLLIGHHFSDGYNELYTFAYSLRDKKPMELPTSNFDVLVISNVQNHDSLFKEKLNDDIINFDNIDKACKNLPKFISLCSNKSENSDILLKQRLTQIKVRPLNSSLSHNFSYFSYLLFIPFKSDDCDDSVSKSQKPGILDRFKIPRADRNVHEGNDNNNATNKSSATEINENSNTETKGGKSREVKDDLSKHKDRKSNTDKSSRKSNTDKSSRKSNTDKSSRKSNTDKSSRKSNTDKSSRKSNTDKSSRKSNTDKSSRKSNTDKSSRKSNTDKNSRKSNTDKGNRKNIVKRFVNDKVRKSNTDKSNRKNSATKDNGKGNTNENDDDESYASESDYESNASESDDKSNAAKEDDENDASEGDNESNASESDDKSNAAKEDDENDAEGDNESNASESDDKSNAAEEDDENNATGESKAKSNSKGSTAEGYGKIKHRSSRKNNNKVKSNGKNGAANDNGKSNNAKDDDENNTTGNYNCLPS